jgi:uncharacterized protein
MNGPRRPPSRSQLVPLARPVQPVRPLSDAEMAELQALLDGAPASLEPLDLSSVDGYLCGVIVQPQPVAETAWWPRVLDVDGRPPPAGFQAARLRVLVGRRHGELADAIARRQWFDPWVFELEAEAEAEADDEDEGDDGDDGYGAAIDAVYPWVTGFTLALETFPRLLECEGPEVSEPLALIYRHLGADNLEDADELQAEIEALEPPADLAAAVEELVRATLLLADAAGLPRR